MINDINFKYYIDNEIDKKIKLFDGIFIYFFAYCLCGFFIKIMFFHLDYLTEELRFDINSNSNDNNGR